MYFHDRSLWREGFGSSRDFWTRRPSVPMFGAGAIVILPILYGGLGFVATLIAAWVYNVVAGIVGGIELDVQ